MSRNSKDDDEEMNLGASSNLIQKNSNTNESDNSIPFCGCLSVKFYQHYFDLNTQDVVDRIGMTLFYCRRTETFLDFLSSHNPDAYGPFWVIYHFFLLNSF